MMENQTQGQEPSPALPPSQKIAPGRITNPLGSKGLLEMAGGRVEKPKALFYKSLLLDVLTGSAALAAGYFSSLYFHGAGSYIIPLSLLTAFLLLSAFSTILIEDTKRRGLMTALTVAALLVFFIDTPRVLLVWAFGALLICFFWGERVSLKERENSIKFRFFQVSRPKFTKMITGMSLAAVLLYSPQWSTGKISISEAQFTMIYAPLFGGIENVYQNITFTQTFEKFISDIARRGLEQQDAFKLLPKDVQDQAIREASQKILENAQKNLGVPVSGDMSLMNVLYRYMITQLGNLQEKLGNTFIILWGIGAFFVIRGIGALLVWIASFVGFGAYELLLAFQLIKIRGESKVKETVEFS